MKFNYRDLPDPVKNALSGIAYAWGFMLGICGGLLAFVLIAGLCITHPLIGVPLLITVGGALCGFLA